MRKSAFITGISGQDGSYLAELLLAKGYSVAGSARDPDHAARALPPHVWQRVQVVPWDMLDPQGITELLRRFEPAEIYNLAAYSSGAGMYNEAANIGEINGVAVARILEAIRLVDSDIRLCQASSSEIFGEADVTPQAETSRCMPRSPYGAAKLYAHSMVRIYRQRYGLHACSAILFNHESPRRGVEFVTRKITHQVARIKLGLSNCLELGNLETRRDWGFAGDYVRAMWQMLAAQQADDYVVASGTAHSVREFCECAFGCVGLDYRQYVCADAVDHRPPEAVQLVGDARKLRERLGWRPEVDFAGLVRSMVEADMRLLGGA
ncbi:MAG TPA: GDP-mannose 4,6-dehydratase [Steroidobacteraceae bacterium]|nr:GDP-mannose 4,6-dehydratase [Steroidobacteraceae bacterium]